MEKQISDELHRIMAHTKYKFGLTKGDKSIQLVDIRRVVQILEQNYNITKKTNMMEFKEFPKLPRLSREMIISEKIDGTNASIFIQNEILEEGDDSNILTTADGFTMRAGSRTRWITPENDNAGFARWVKENSTELFKLGEGHHFGEWWGSGIQCGYGLQKGEKTFSLFNIARWREPEDRPICCEVVPCLYEGIFDTNKVTEVLEQLKQNGSYAAPGFMKPEGIVVWHNAANLGFKKTILKDETPKSLQ